jgi:hypothetical protein
VSVHTALPEAHDTVPTSHELLGVQVAPDRHPGTASVLASAPVSDASVRYAASESRRASATATSSFGARLSLASELAITGLWLASTLPASALPTL